MQPKPQMLKLERTGQYLAVPFDGPLGRDAPLQQAVDRCIAQLALVSGH
ncbi:MAG: hypothetical protein QOD66_3494 [Solirubrobacteraceae bacterium]|nr:hypothetical protein [Solirubrobacteraceae bacterium]